MRIAAKCGKQHSLTTIQMILRCPEQITPMTNSECIHCLACVLAMQAVFQDARGPP
jgi:polyferredoxin